MKQRAGEDARGGGVAAGTACPQHGLPAVLSDHLMPIFAALRLRGLYQALGAVCGELLGCERLTVLTFQRRSPRARLRFTTDRDLAAHTDRLIPFDDGPLCAALRAGIPAEAKGVEPLVWSAFDGASVVSARAVRPLVFDDEPYGGILFLDWTEPADRAAGGPMARAGGSGDEPSAALLMDLIARAAGVALMKCELEEERARQVVDSRVRLDAITRMGRVLNSLDLEVLLQRMIEVALSAVNGQVGSIVLARGDRLETVVEWGLDHAVAEAIHYAGGRTVMREVYETKLPVLVKDPADSGRIRVTRQDVSIESYLCIPLHTNRRTLGVLNIINSTSGHAFSDRDLDLLLTICNLASAALENALLHEQAMAKERIDTQLDIASGIQKSLLPSAAPSLPGLDLAGWNHPCEAVGGDYFDFLELPDERLAVVIGDVSGHGVGPALLMSSARAALRSLVSCQISPEDIMGHLNRLLTDQVLSPGTFITMIVAIVDVADRRLLVSNAGHPPPLIFNTSSLSIREPLERGLVLGVDPGADYPAGSAATLGAGDIVVFYTDGVPDATNELGEPFGKDRLMRTLVASRDRSAREIIDAIRAEIRTFCGDSSPADDLTLVLVKAL